MYFRLFCKELRQVMDKHETKYEIKETFSTCISEWLFNGEVTVCKYAPSHARVICSQTQIGWDQLFRGKMSVEWMGPPRTIYEKPRDRKSGIRLGRGNRRMFPPKYCGSLGDAKRGRPRKDKTEKQHKRKLKLAEQIRELQKEKEYVRPRDEHQQQHQQHQHQHQQHQQQ